MSLLSAKISPRKRLSFTPKKTRIEDSLEDIEFSRLAEVDPIIGDLVDMFDLVDSDTDRQPQRVDLSQYYKLAIQVLPPETSASPGEIIKQLEQTFNITTARAENGFKKLLASGAILPTLNPNLYYLKGSTPF